MNKKKIVMRTALCIFLCSLIFFFLKKGYRYYDSVLQFGKNYFGIYFFPAVLIIFLDIFFIFINSKKKKILYRTRLFFFIIFTISVSNIFVLINLKYLNILDEYNIIETCLLKYNMGFLMTNLIVYTFDSFKLNYVIIFFSFFIFVSLFFLTGREIIGVIKYIIKFQRRRNALKLEKILLEQVQAQIEIKEKLAEKRAVEYEKQGIIRDIVIKEKLAEAMEKDILPLEAEKIDSDENKNPSKEEKEK